MVFEPLRIPNSIRLQNWAIEQLPGISDEHQQQLNILNIFTTFDLLNATRTQSARLKLAQQLNSHIKYVNKWTALAQLACLPSVGCKYCGLLLHAGISSPQQLALLPVAQLHSQLKRLQIKLMQRADLSPDTAQVSQWITEAKQLCR
ncbi:DUF4332 domain-containing protein [Leptolyngbyaceae cyanobacterium CCMR0082]|uniref:DUF4332 domain-containing protein n=2 Tax=Adonisia turfae TaxID=2950184 RepID=A0A6M0S9T6_9CYAN|nr:DUF4332 domain-containing protein [Adonisia turfae]MDV3347458.1 DUF4332 domain-containing protein [Leptothoe sp. LEGE 181152]NEZ56595.1 DUF4332 domain-containing protein [Adonisia turfae CCMR0081]NEZ64502.1 DUF4332 domain-containing protein [Adonisia turfae CCMR0082]